MNQIGSLISELCPHGVSFVTLDSLFKIRKGENLTNSQAVPGVYPVVTASRGSTFTHNDFNFSGECITISSHGAYAGFVSYYNQGFWLGNNVYLFERNGEGVSTRFYFHVLKSLTQALLATVNTGGIPYINAKDLLKLRVPNPPIEIQHEIVNILDKFTNLEVELEAELEARKSQYEYYRHHLLTFSEEETEEVQILTLGEICMIKSGQGISKEIIAENPGPYPVINSGREPLGYYDHFNTENDPLGITSRGAGVGSVTWCDAPFFRGNLNYSVTVRNEHEVSPRYLYFWLLANQREIHKLCTFEAIPALNKSNLEKLEIPLPSLSGQLQIVSPLNKFEELAFGFTFGLPAEISARRKQYEHYRARLLTFRELGVA